MEKRVVLVTGSSRGIGRELIKLYAKNGYDVVINYYSSKDLAYSLKDEVDKLYNIDSLVINCDVSNEVEVKELFNTIMNRFGRIDVVVNNAAIEEISDISEKNKSSFERVLGTNLIGTFLVSKEAGNIMMEQKNGKIINISSDNGIDQCSVGTMEYDVSKAGINVLTKDLAKAYSPYVNVNAVAPGWVLTEANKELDESLGGVFVSSESEKILLKRFADPIDICNVVYFLSSDEAKYINGQVIVVDGGR